MRITSRSRALALAELGRFAFEVTKQLIPVDHSFDMLVMGNPRQIGSVRRRAAEHKRLHIPLDLSCEFRVRAQLQRFRWEGICPQFFADDRDGGHGVIATLRVAKNEIIPEFNADDKEPWIII